MSDIKMSDVFDLPVTGLLCDDFKEGITIDDGEMYTIAAINSYDENQEEIKALKAQVEEFRMCLQLALVCAETMGDESFVIFVSETQAINYVEILNRGQDALDKAPQQCLANLRADFLDLYAKDWTGITYPLGDGDVREVANEIRKDAHQLRDDTK